MQLEPATAAAYLRGAFDDLVAVAERLGDDRVNQRPHGPSTNSVAALVVHCCGVAEWWLGHVLLGRASDRDRAAEFTAEASVAELRELVAATLTRVAADLDRIGAGPVPGRPDEHARRHLPAGDGSPAGVVLHVIEELYQHLGHAELTADALGA